MSLRKLGWNLLAAVPLACGAPGPVAPEPLPPRHLQIPSTQGPLEISSVAALQSLLHRDFDRNWPEYRGQLIQIMHTAPGTPEVLLEDLQSQFRDRFWESALARTRPEVRAAAQAVNQALDAEAERLLVQLTEREEKWSRLGNSQGHSLPLPVAGADGQALHWEYVHISLCSSCDYVALPSIWGGYGRCERTHPDYEYLHQLGRLSVGYHELMHAVAHLAGWPGSEWNSAAARSEEEVRAYLAGALVPVHIYGPGLVPLLDGVEERTSRLLYPERGFNSRAFARARTTLENGAAAVLPKMTIRQTFELAKSIARQSALSEAEAEALARIGAQSSLGDIKARLQVRNQQIAANQVSETIEVEGRTIPYPTVAYQMDVVQERVLERSSVWTWVRTLNPLRLEGGRSTATCLPLTPD